jgi:hypothetical protein
MADPHRWALFTLLKLMAAADPPVPAMTGSVLVPAAALADGGAGPDILVAGLRKLRIGDLLGNGSPLQETPLRDLSASPLFDVATVRTPPDSGSEEAGDAG